MQPRDILAAEEKQAEKDAVFIRVFLENEEREDGAVIACRTAGILDPTFPVAVLAEKQLARPEIRIAIKAARTVRDKTRRREITPETIEADLEQVFNSALIAKDHAAATNNRKLLAQLKGFLTENVVVTHRYDVNLMSDEELGKIAAKGMKVIESKARDITPKAGIGKVVEVTEIESGT